ncbi:hypothetical protein ATCC90586_006638 [Pythium insidiosum]|nr:hypothetical protein ATCC90586_006638 [Pythium insidiosum]
MKRLEKKPLVASPSDPRAYGGVYAAPCPAVDVATGSESSVKAVIDFSAARGLWKTVSFAWVDDLLQDGSMRSIQDMESTCRTNIDIDDEELDAAVREAFDGADLPPGRRERGRFRRILSTLLVVLDDAVKHLEPTALPRLQRILQDQWKTISVWIITDHADIVQSLDRVVVLDKGQVVETGTPKELLKKSKTPLRRLIDEWKTLRLRK